MTIAAIFTDSRLTVMFPTGPKTVDSSHANWKMIVEHYKDKANWADDSQWQQEFEMLCDVSKAVQSFGKGTITVVDGVVHYNGTELHNSLTSRLLKMMTEGFDINPLVRFLENLMENPSFNSVNQLYRFLEANSLPITDDGYFLAYKNVGADYLDKHSRTFDNSVGNTCSMPRNQVNEDANQTCSAGLHVCSREYLDSMWGFSGHTMIVKVNPRDVVAVPHDYKNSKMRVCEYTVIGEIDQKDKALEDRDSVYYTEEEYESEYMDDIYDDYE